MYINNKLPSYLNEKTNNNNNQSKDISSINSNFNSNSNNSNNSNPPTDRYIIQLDKLLKSFYSSQMLVNSNNNTSDMKYDLGMVVSSVKYFVTSPTPMNKT